MTTSRAGRPRLVASARSGTGGRAQILDAAAELFSRQGYAMTTTRQIGDAAGVRQASIYYHFANKQELLSELLATTVRPSLDFSRRPGVAGETALVRLYLLVRFDVTLLGGGRWNLGALYAMPELGSEEFATFRDERDQLRRAYGDLVAEAAAEGLVDVDDPGVATWVVFALAESVISMRAAGSAVPDGLPDLVATAALRSLGCPADLVDASVERARRCALTS